MKNRPLQPIAIFTIICGRPFKTQTPATRKALRLAAVSQKLGREIKSFKDLSDAEIKSLLEQWGHHESRYLPSERGSKEIQELAKAYQDARRQLSLL